MENQLGRSPIGPKYKHEGTIRYEDIKIFANLLSRSRMSPTINKTQKQISQELNVVKHTIEKWEKGETFPTEDKLPVIAKAYGIELEELSNAFNVSKQAHKQEINSLPRHDRKKPKIDPNF